jgi:hypothetical protein
MSHLLLRIGAHLDQRQARQEVVTSSLKASRVLTHLARTIALERPVVQHAQ